MSQIAAPESRGAGRWDDGLAVSQSEPKRLLKLNAETGDVEQANALENMEWINGVTRAGDRLVVGDGFLGCSVIVDPENPEKMENGVFGGPIPQGSRRQRLGRVASGRLSTVPHQERPESARRASRLG